MTTTGEWVDPDDAPELGADWFEGADVKVAGEVVSAGERPKRAGRPPVGDEAKVQQTLRLPPSVVEAYRATGPGWHGRMEGVLRAAMDCPSGTFGGEIAVRHMFEKAGGVEAFVKQVEREGRLQELKAAVIRFDQDVH